MGKKNKKNSSMKIESGITEAKVSSSLKQNKITDKNLNKVNGQPKLKNKKLHISNNEPDNKTEILKKHTQKQKSYKRKSEDAELNIISSICKKKAKSHERKPSTREARTTDKKVVNYEADINKEDISKTPKAKFLNEDEAEVRDQDIDKFCDEITEEDNKTYENWVEMFEANFKKNKK